MNNEKNWVSDVLAFWFSELDQKQWFIKSDATDDLIRKRFTGLHKHLADMPVNRLLDTAEMALASIIVLDQFRRNMFRNTAAAFASDTQALALAKQAVELGCDQKFNNQQRIFFYLPFEHSEELADQERCVALVSALGNDEYTRYAQAHRDIIFKFGRFPHRNTALGRPSTAEEKSFLTQPGSSF